MKTFRILALIFGLVVLFIVDPSIRNSIRTTFGLSERDKAAQCVVLADYVSVKSGDELKAAAYDRLATLLGNEFQECIEKHATTDSSTPRLTNACLSYVRRYEESARIRAFPNGDSSDLSTIRKWAKTGYCESILSAYQASHPTQASPTRESSPFARAADAVPPQASQATQAEAPPAVSNPDGTTYDPADVETDPGAEPANSESMPPQVTPVQ